MFILILRAVQIGFLLATVTNLQTMYWDITTHCISLG